MRAGITVQERIRGCRMTRMGNEYDQAYGQPDYFGSSESPLLKRYAQHIPPGATVLDVGVGQGRNALPLARRGLRVTGLDTSETSIRQVQEAAVRERLSLQTLQTGFADFFPREPFQVVLCFGLLQMLPPDQGASLIHRLHGWTAPGGLLFLVAWHVDDPGFATCAQQWQRTGRRSFRSPDGERFRTYLGRQEVLEFFRGWNTIHHQEALGPVHRHGDGPEERHGEVELVAVRS